MAQSQAQHASYIDQHLSKYGYKRLTKSALMSTLNAFSDLRPKYDTFVFSNNTQKDLLSLDGTVPVSFKGATYNIPIRIWLFETHPFNPPVCYVRTTKGMIIKPSRHVDAGGKVYLPYLYEWKHPNTDLIGLIKVMTIIFGENCPVYSRPANQPPRMPQMMTPYPGSQPPPSQAPKSTLKKYSADVDLKAKQSLSYGEMKNDVADLLVGENRLRIMNYLEWNPAEMRKIKTSLELMAKMEETAVFSKGDICGLIKLLRKSLCFDAAETAERYKPSGNIQNSKTSKTVRII